MNPKPTREAAIAAVPPEFASRGHASGVPDRLVELFRDLILRGEWKPGAAIVETAVAKSMGFSQPTVREALKHLEAEGLILRRPFRSCEVTQLSREEVDQIFRLRIEWETFAAELAVENRGNWSVQDLKDAAERLVKAARNRDAEAFYRYDLAFHKTFWACTGNAFLAKALMQITVPLFAFWTLRHLRESEVNLIEQAEAHERMAEAMATADKRRARSVTRQAMKKFWMAGARVSQ
ncbi:MAG: GntR family transcriptional regulator [Bryobacterales bacterium]|nr:GntR family transcriptional regulator [Bryobacterales bacterium]